MGLLWTSSTSAFSAFLLRSLERQYPPLPIEESPVADAIVVLGGSVGAAESPRIEVDLADASDRVLHTARLFRAGKAPMVIAAGGAMKWLGFKTPQAEAIRSLLLEWGVPANSIVQETESLNTHQNAVNTKKVLEGRGLETVLLVTSATHMPRALATFRTAGIKAIPSPADYRVVDRKKFSISVFLPDAGALAGTTQAIREYLALMVYKWRGWIR